MKNKPTSSIHKLVSLNSKTLIFVTEWVYNFAYCSQFRRPMSGTMFSLVGPTKVIFKFNWKSQCLDRPKLDLNFSFKLFIGKKILLLVSFNCASKYYQGEWSKCSRRLELTVFHSVGDQLQKLKKEKRKYIKKKRESEWVREKKKERNKKVRMND